MKRRTKRNRSGLHKSFADRGGLWVLAQVPLMTLAFVIAPVSGSGSLIPYYPLAVTGAVVFLLGAGVTGWGLASLGEALTPFPQPLSDATLHRQGAYRWMRHPIYTGVILASIGWALWWLSVPGAVGALAVAIFFDRKAAYEETWLRKKYKGYGDYARRVRKFLPGMY